FLATMDDGKAWALQAKLTPKFGLTEATAAVKKARREFPRAQRYFLLVSGTPTTAALEYVHRQKSWELWDGVSLTAHCLRGISIRQQIELISRIWPTEAAGLIVQLYPLRDALLVTPEEFFANWLKVDRLFHHRAALVGNARVLDELSDFLRDPRQR